MAERAWIEDSDYPYVWGDFAGYDTDGWEDSVWVLHSIHEDVHAPGHLGHAAEGASLPEAKRKHPEKGERVRWSEVATRMGVALGDAIGVPPCYRWLSGFTWLDYFYPLWEGVLDDDNYERITAAIATTSETTPTEVFGFFGWLSTNASSGERRDDIALYEGPIEEAVTWRLWDGHQNSPSNIWPHDHSWIMYTDYDLMATKVSGSKALIAALEADDYLETLRWKSPPGSN